MKNKIRTAGGMLLLGGIGLLLLVGCNRPPIERALRGSMLPFEENLVVRNHCQGCHVHANFETNPHIERVRRLYARDHPLREANRCLQCHQLSLENIFRRERRATTFPHGKLVDMAEIPKPQPGKVPAGEAEKKDAKKPEEKKRRWYFLYLF